MKASFTAIGFGAAITLFSSFATKVPEGARKQMHRAAARVVKRAQLYVPEDEQLLKKSIRVEKSYGERGRLVITIVAGNMMAVKASGRTIDLNQYAALVHEAYETQVAPNGPGPNTLAKMEANPGVSIGSGFLTRAHAEEEERLRQRLVQVIDDIIEGRSE